MTKTEMDYVTPQWSAPFHVQALTTLRLGGYSQGDYRGLNLADHVGDDFARVKKNRSLLRSSIGYPADPYWLEQVHGSRVVQLDDSDVSRVADGSISRVRGVVCAVLSADCVPLFITDKSGQFVALLHVGWRGLEAGIVESGLDLIPEPMAEVLTWIGPSIGPTVYEVGDDVRGRLLRVCRDHDSKFAKTETGWLADLPGMVEQRLRRAGVETVGSSGLCTFSAPFNWFSHRRSAPCGRMASLIWLT
jgi:hypothetical protein